MEKHFPYLFWGYNIIWILMGSYLIFLGLRMHRLQKRIEQLRASLEPGEAGRPR